MQHNVQEALRWKPHLDAGQIGVTVKDGVDTLTDTLNNYPQKLEAEAAAKNVAGVKAVVEKLTSVFWE